MDHPSSRRIRSPPLGYDPRSAVHERDIGGHFETMQRQNTMPHMGPLDFQPRVDPTDPVGAPYMIEPQRNNYPASYRDSRLPSTYRQTLRSYPIEPPAQPPRSGSPSYKILCITNINNKIDDLGVKNALMSDFSRFGDISVSICHDSGERLAYIYFRSHQEAHEARMSKSRTIFFDRPLEIEPIYDPGNSTLEDPSHPPPPPPSYGQSIIPPQMDAYSPRNRRSITPPDFHYEMNGPSPRRIAMSAHMATHHDLTPPVPSNRRPFSPPEYHPNLQTGYVSHGPSPPPLEPASFPPVYDRRQHSGPRYAPSSHMSPYSSPPHDSYRSPYNYGHRYSPPNYSSGAPPVMTRPDRERIYPDIHYASSRNALASNSYYPPESREPHVPYSHSYHPSSRTLSHHRGSPGVYPPTRSGSHHHAALPTHRHRPGLSSPPHHYPSRPYNRPDPPIRFMSREYKREKYGISDPQSSELDDGRPSRVLLVNNIDSSKTESDLRDIFEPLGMIEALEVKRVTPDISSALIKYSSMDGAYKAKSATHGRFIGKTKCSIVYGKVSASRRLWIGGLSSSTTIRSLEDECCKYGELTSMEYTSGRPYSYVEFETPNQAQFAAHHLRTTLEPAPDRKIRIEFVDPERSERMSRHDANSQTSETKSRTTNESWASNERDTSPASIVGRKRSPSPADSSTKRLCPVNDALPVANTFKHERLAAAAAAKARSSCNANQDTEISPETNQSTRQYESNNNARQRSDNGKTMSDTSENSGDNIENDNLNYEAPTLDTLAQCSSVSEILTFCPVSWPCHVALRNFIFPSKLILLKGSKEVVGEYLMKFTCNQDSHPLLRITQRWRMHPQPKLEEVKKRMHSGNIGMLIITSCQDFSNIRSAQKTVNVIGDKLRSDQNGEESVDNGKISAKPVENVSFTSTGDSNQINTATHSPDDSKVKKLDNSSSSQDANITKQSNASILANSQSRPLRNLISYLEQKDAAGVVSLNALDESGSQQASVGVKNSDSANPRLLYTFPPGEFAYNLIKQNASNLSSEISKEEFLLGVIVGASVEGKP